MTKKLTKSEINKRIAKQKYKKIEKDLRPLIKKHGERALVWGVTKWVYKIRQKNRWLRQKEEAEQELRDLSKKLK